MSVDPSSVAATGGGGTGAAGIAANGLRWPCQACR